MEWTRDSLPEMLTANMTEEEIQRIAGMCQTVEEGDLEWFVEKYPTKHGGHDGHAYVDIQSETAIDSSYALIFQPSFLSRWSASGMALHAIAMRMAMPRPMRLVVFPHYTEDGQPAFQLSRSDRKEVSDGVFSPIAARQMRSLHELGIKHAFYFGFGMGAAVGVEAVRQAALERATLEGDYFQVHSSLFIEPPNTVDRTISGLLGAMLSLPDNWSLWRGLPKELADVSAGDGLLRTLQEKRTALPRLLLSSDTRVLLRGMQTDTFYDVFHAAMHRMRVNRHPGRLAVGRAMLSRVVSKEGLIDTARPPKRMRLIEVPEFGHELGDNPLACAMLARMTVSCDL